MASESKHENPPKNCQEIVDLLNDLVDGEIDEERVAKAEQLIQESPQCRVFFNTLMKTIELYRTRSRETQNYSPSFNWNALKSAGDAETPDSTD